MRHLCGMAFACSVVAMLFDRFVLLNWLIILSMGAVLVYGVGGKALKSLAISTMHLHE